MGNNIYQRPLKERLSLIAGGAAGNHTLTGITLDDQIMEVHHLGAAAGSVGISHTVSAGEDTAGTVDIDTGLGANLVAYSVLILTAAGVNHQLTDAAISEAAGVITIADGAATFTLDATDVIMITAATAAGAPADLSSEFSITAANTINNSGGTASTNGFLLIKWYDRDYGDAAEVP